MAVVVVVLVVVVVVVVVLVLVRPGLQLNLPPDSQLYQLKEKPQGVLVMVLVVLVLMWFGAPGTPLQYSPPQSTKPSVGQTACSTPTTRRQSTKILVGQASCSTRCCADSLWHVLTHELVHEAGCIGVLGHWGGV